MARRTDEFMRIAEMLKSIEPDLDYPNDTHSKAQVMRAAMGSIDVSDDATMTAICGCGWRGTMLDCHWGPHDNSAWAQRAGRKGYHWDCPQCGETVWKYYNIIN